MGFTNNYSPLRYPGGKAAITDFFVGLLDRTNITRNGTYCEPFAGGAGVALTLLLTGRVSNIIINDYDKHIAAFWKTIISEPDAFIAQIQNVEISIDEWERQRYIYDNIDNFNIDIAEQRLKIGFSSFFLNRCNRAGILPKAGPIGGKKQTGKYKINARFNKEKMIERIKTIVAYKNNISITNLDAEKFLDSLPQLTQTGCDTFLYLDPPYYKNGEKLYLNFYEHQNHLSLAQKMSRFDFCPWIMTYDDCQEIRAMYESFSNMRISELPIQYSMQKVRKASEIMIFTEKMGL